MNVSQASRRIVVLLIGCMLLVTTAGIATAAVSGDFSTTYDGYDDGESTEARGNEIAVQGQIEITGDPAVNPTIVVQGDEWAVLDTASIEVFVEGDRSIQFDRSFRGGEVRLSTSEIPTETTIRLEYRTYYTGGSDSASITASTVQFEYNSPSGDRTRETFQPDTSLENRPEEFVAEVNSANQLSQIQRILSYIGAGGLVLLLFGLVLSAIGGKNPPGGGGPGPR
ncbi:MAG: hypothetical protein ACQET5_06390 [Halobacteriota archaeon]|uniref:hypothetical protein n=1 Tax=Natronomonas sp. TaxID=2184060 RepID=UPI0039754108